MASIKSLVAELKKRLHTEHDLDKMLKHLGTTVDLKNTVFVNNLQRDGKFHVFFCPVEGVESEKIGLIETRVWVRLDSYPHDYAHITAVVDDGNYEDHLDSYETFSPGFGTRLYAAKWSDHGIYHEDMCNDGTFNDDTPGDPKNGGCPWYPSGDHKDPSWDAYAEVDAYIYFRRSKVKHLLLGEKYTILLEGEDEPSDYTVVSGEGDEACLLLVPDAEEDDNGDDSLTLSELESIPFVILG